MSDNSIMPASVNTQLLSLAYARTAVAAAPAASNGVGLALMAKQLDQARAELRDGETFSVNA